jgi:hydroxymethylbilane synthase
MLPIVLRPDGRRAVVVGGGSAAARKAEALFSAGFPVFVIAPSIEARLRERIAAFGGVCALRAYESGDLEGAALAVAATDDAGVNARVVADARRLRVLVCDAAEPERGDFSFPAVVRRGELTIAVDSAGSAPAFSKRVAREIAAALTPQHAQAAANLRRVRAQLKATFAPPERAEILRSLAEKPLGELAALSAGSAVCASRKSRLAMLQTRHVAARLAQRGIATTILGITTTGDRLTSGPIQLAGINVFVKELEHALLERRADYAVHSCKDLPSETTPGLRIVAISAREDPRDAFCSVRFASFDALPPGSLVGTSSPRRRAQLHALRSDLRYDDLRGNVDTRLRKLHEGRFDAIVLAMAGLNRLQAVAPHTVPFDPSVLVPAAGQGALAVEVRDEDEPLARELRAAVNDERAELCVRCERAALHALRAGCSAPAGVHARLDGNTMTVYGAFASAGILRRERIVDSVTRAEQAQALGERMASILQAEVTAAQ